MSSVIYGIYKGQTPAQATVTPSSSSLPFGDVEVAYNLATILNHNDLIVALEELIVFIMQDQTLAQ